MEIDKSSAARRQLAEVKNVLKICRQMKTFK